MRFRHLLILPLLLLIGCNKPPAAPAPVPSKPAAKQITVFAAASTIDVLRAIGAQYEAKTKTKVSFSFDATSTLAKQIKSGAPADLFLSADEKWMDDLVTANAVQPASRENLLGNDLVLIAPLGKTFEVKFAKDFDFAASLPHIKRITLGDPSHVPAGRYAQQALEKLTWWSSLQPRLAPSHDVRAALRIVEIGEADAGIVYATDAKSSRKVFVIGAFPADSHDPIRYPIALCKDAKPEAADFLKFLRTPEAAQVFESAGFSILPPAAKPAP